jgi:RHS repeat-associated protein
MKIKMTVLFLLFLIVIQPLVFAETLNLIYDANGNLVSGDGVFRVYNSLNQLWKVYNGSDSSGELLLQYMYHPVEERVYYKTRYFSGGNETTIYISQNYVRVINSSGTFDYTYVFHGGQQVAQLLSSGTKQYIHGNHEGSSSVVTNSSGGVVERTDYTPFGEISLGGSKTRYDYENKEFDTSLESFDFHFRQYKPEWGLFTQPDTLIQNVYDPQSLNRYMFERGNPYGNVDEDGHNILIITIGAAIAIFALSLYEIIYGADINYNKKRAAESLQFVIDSPNTPVGEFNKEYADIVKQQMDKQVFLNDIFKFDKTYLTLEEKEYVKKVITPELSKLQMSFSDSASKSLELIDCSSKQCQSIKTKVEMYEKKEVDKISKKDKNPTYKGKLGEYSSWDELRNIAERNPNAKARDIIGKRIN